MSTLLNANNVVLQSAADWSGILADWEAAEAAPSGSRGIGGGNQRRGSFISADNQLLQRAMNTRRSQGSFWFVGLISRTRSAVIRPPF